LTKCRRKNSGASLPRAKSPLGGPFCQEAASVGGFFPFLGTHFCPTLSALARTPLAWAKEFRPDLLSYLNDRDSDWVSNATCAARGLRTVWIATRRQPRPQNPRCSRASGVLFRPKARASAQ